MKILHLSDIHIGSGFSHGRLNPATGLNTRLEDFVNCLSIAIDRAIAEPVDLVLFGGDAFPDATPPPFVQEAFAGQFRRLVDAEIPTVLLVGNHDQHSQGQGGASLCIYRTLGVPGFIVGDRIMTYQIATKSGLVNVLTLPWLTRATLMTRQETEGCSLAQVNEKLVDRLQPILEHEIRVCQRDPEVPTILLAHLMADRATLGAERFLAVGKGFTLPVSLLIRDCFDYVALGHVHKHQNLNPDNNPPVVYPGSIERVDFSEEKEEKGFVLIDIEAKGRVKWEFVKVPARPFITIEVNVSKEEEPMLAILRAIAKKNITDAVVRLIYKLQPDQLELIKIADLHQGLSLAHSYTISAELISQLARPRLPEIGVGNSIDPIAALSAYLETQDRLKNIAKDMIESANRLLETTEQEWYDSLESESDTHTNNQSTQLTLL